MASREHIPGRAGHEAGDGLWEAPFRHREHIQAHQYTVTARGWFSDTNSPHGVFLESAAPRGSLCKGSVELARFLRLLLPLSVKTIHEKPWILLISTCSRREFIASSGDSDFVLSDSCLAILRNRTTLCWTPGVKGVIFLSLCFRYLIITVKLKCYFSK